MSEQFDKAFRALMGDYGNREVVFEFVSHCKTEDSAMRSDAYFTAHSIGHQDAGRWWLSNIRELCPEREAQMRNEAIKRWKDQQHEVSNDDE